MEGFSARATDSLSLCYCGSMNYGHGCSSDFSLLHLSSLHNPVESNDHAPLRPDLRGHRRNYEETGENCDCRRVPAVAPGRGSLTGSDLSFRTAFCCVPGDHPSGWRIAPLADDCGTLRKVRTGTD